jgi:hypothetical protein
METDITKLSLTELKALAYDEIVQLETARVNFDAFQKRVQNNLNALQDEMKKLEPMLTAKKGKIK